MTDRTKSIHCLNTDELPKTISSNEINHVQKVSLKLTDKAIESQIALLFDRFEVLKTELKLTGLSKIQYESVINKVAAIENVIKQLNKEEHLDKLSTEIRLQLQCLTAILNRYVKQQLRDDPNLDANANVIALLIRKFNQNIQECMEICEHLYAYEQTRKEEHQTYQAFLHYKAFLTDYFKQLSIRIIEIEENLASFSGEKVDKIKRNQELLKQELNEFIEQINPEKKLEKFTQTEFEALILVIENLQKLEQEYFLYSTYLKLTYQKINPAQKAAHLRQPIENLRSRCLALHLYLEKIIQSFQANNIILNSFANLKEDQEQAISEKKQLKYPLLNNVNILLEILKSELSNFKEKLQKTFAAKNLVLNIELTEILVQFFNSDISKNGFQLHKLRDLKAVLDLLIKLEICFEEIHNELNTETKEIVIDDSIKYILYLLSIIKKTKQISQQTMDICSDDLIIINQEITTQINKLASELNEWENQNDITREEFLLLAKDRNPPQKAYLNNENILEIRNAIKELNDTLNEKKAPLTCLAYLEKFYAIIQNNHYFLTENNQPLLIHSFIQLFTTKLNDICEKIQFSIYDDVKYQGLYKNKKECHELYGKLKSYQSINLYHMLKKESIDNEDPELSLSLLSLKKPEYAEFSPQSALSLNEENSTKKLVLKENKSVVISELHSLMQMSDSFPMELYLFVNQFVEFLRNYKTDYHLYEPEVSRITQCLKPFFSSNDSLAIKDIFYLVDLEKALADFKNTVKIILTTEENTLANRDHQYNKEEKANHLFILIDNLSKRIKSLVSNNSKAIIKKLSEEIFYQIDDITECYDYIYGMKEYLHQMINKEQVGKQFDEMKKHLDIIFNLNVPETKVVDSSFLFSLGKLYHLCNSLKPIFEDMAEKAYHHLISVNNGSLLVFNIHELINNIQEFKASIGNLTESDTDLDENVFITKEDIKDFFNNSMSLLFNHPELIALARDNIKDSYFRFIDILKYQGEMPTIINFHLPKEIYISEYDINLESYLLYLIDNESIFNQVEIPDDLFWHKSKLKYALLEKNAHLNLGITELQNKFKHQNQLKLNSGSSQEHKYEKLYTQLAIVEYILSNNEICKNVEKFDFIHSVLCFAEKFNTKNESNKIHNLIKEKLEKVKVLLKNKYGENYLLKLQQSALVNVENQSLFKNTTNNSIFKLNFTNQDQESATELKPSNTQ